MESTAKQEFIEKLSLLKLQNLSGREDVVEAFEKGIDVAYDELKSMTDCTEFAKWLRENYNTEYMGDVLPIGKYRKYFTEEIYTVEELYEQWINER